MFLFSHGFGRFMIIISIAIGIIGYFNQESYNSERGFLWNARYQTVSMPLLYGRNPLECAFDYFRKMIPNPTDESFRPVPGCDANTKIKYNKLLVFCILLFAWGAYFGFRNVSVANLWPTEWTPFSKDNVSDEVKLREQERQKNLREKE